MTKLIRGTSKGCDKGQEKGNQQPIVKLGSKPTKKAWGEGGPKYKHRVTKTKSNCPTTLEETVSNKTLRNVVLNAV